MNHCLFDPGQEMPKYCEVEDCYETAVWIISNSIVKDRLSCPDHLNILVTPDTPNQISPLSLGRKRNSWRACIKPTYGTKHQYETISSNN
jgi:hypothetical protein